jgi:hypothetical protein
LPYHRIPRARLHEDITAIEREGERVTACTLEGDDALVFTCWLGERLETRPLTSRLRDVETRACSRAGCEICGDA